MMKPIAAVALLLTFATAAGAQQLRAAAVPAAVRQSYRAKFPGARPVEWKLKTDRNYEAEFKLKGMDVAVKFDPSGAWLETETTIRRSELPPVVRAAIARDFKGYTVVETQRLVRVSGGDLLEVHMQNAKEVLKTQFDPGGALVSKGSKPRGR